MRVVNLAVTFGMVHIKLLHQQPVHCTCWHKTLPPHICKTGFS